MADSLFSSHSRLSARGRAMALHWEIAPPADRREGRVGRALADRRRWWNCQSQRAVRNGRLEEDPRVARPWERVRSRYLGTHTRRTRPPEGRQQALDLERKEA